MLAAKQFDIVTGLDIHIIITPTGVPVPIPHPFIGMVFDVFDFIPFIGATVYVNNTPRATAGTEGKNVPFHIPIGGAFAIPPGNDCEIFMGSATVLAEGEPLSFSGMPVLSCHSIGMPSVPRKAKKPKKPVFYLPTSMLMTIPKGSPVMVGGPPTISMMAMGMKAGMKGLGKLRKSKVSKAVSNVVHDGAAKMMNKVGMPRSIRNRVHKAICFVTGHPVDVPTGKVFTDTVDFELPGPIPLKWERTWYSTSTYDGPLGHGWHHNYDIKLAVDDLTGAIAVLLADGRTTIFDLPAPGDHRYDRQEKLTLLHDDDGLALKDADKLLYRFTKSYKEHLWNLKSIESPAGHKIQFRYVDDNLSEIIDSAHRKIEILSDSSGRITTIKTENIGEEVFLARYSYSEEGDLIRYKDALDHKATCVYENHLLIRETNRNGLSFSFEYDGIDENARCIRTWGDGGIYDHKLTYLDGLTIVENSLGHRTTYVHDGQGLVSKVIDPEGNAHITEFNSFTDIVTETDPLGNTTGYTYDRRGNRLGIINPDGSATSVYYEDDRPLMVKAPNGAQFMYQYNDIGQVTTRVAPEGDITHYEYKEGLLHKIIDAYASETVLQYDSQYNLKRLILPDGSESTWNYDELGNCTSSTDPKGNSRRLTYDKLGRVTGIKEPDGNERKLEYDPEGNVTRARDEQHEVKFKYRGMGKMVEREENNTKVAFEYDTEEQLRCIKNEHGKQYSFHLSPTGEVIEEKGFDNLTKRYKRDAAGRVQSVVRPGGKLSKYRYDENGRVTRIDYGDGSYEYFEFDPSGTLLGAGNEDGAVVFERDKAGRVVKEIQNGIEVSRKYDYLGRCTKVETSLGASISYKRNEMGEVSKATASHFTEKETEGDPVPDWEAKFERDLFGIELERQLPGGVKSRWQRDKLGRPLHHIVQQGQRTTRSKSYSWGTNDRLRQISDSLTDSFVQFGHDPFGNLAWAKYGEEEYQLRMPDEVGNLFKSQDKKEKYGDAGQLLQKDNTKYFYDEEGNLIRKIQPKGVAWDYEWFDNGHLKKVIRPDLKEVAFTYDALGRRTSKTFEGKTTRWIWDSNVPIHEWVEEVPKADENKQNEAGVEEIAKTGSIQVDRQGLINFPAPDKDKLTTWVFEDAGSFIPLAKLKGGKQYSIITDYLGTPTQVYTSEGDKIWEAELDSYGKIRRLQGHATTCPFRYQGQYEDVETGLYYNRFRYYNPEDGQYVSQDPIGLMGGIFNLYSYTHDTNYFLDIFGLSACKGKAVIRQFENGHPEGHFSIEVFHGNKKLHTHQVINGNPNHTIIIDSRKFSPGNNPAHTSEIEIPDAKAAMEFQNELIKIENLGKYDVLENSCLSHVVDVLNKGGLGEVSKSRLGYAKFLKRNGFSLLK